MATGAMSQFCYKDEEVLVKHLKNDIHMVMQRHDILSATLHFEERPQGQPAKLIPVPKDYTLIEKDTMKASGMLNDCYYLIHHACDYHLTSSEGMVLSITNPMLHVIELQTQLRQ